MQQFRWSIVLANEDRFGRLVSPATRHIFKLTV